MHLSFQVSSPPSQGGLEVAEGARAMSPGGDPDALVGLDPQLLMKVIRDTQQL